LSLALFAGMAILLVRSCWFLDEIDWKIYPVGEPSYVNAFRSVKGLIIFDHRDGVSGTADVIPGSWWAESASSDLFVFVRDMYHDLPPFIGFRCTVEYDVDGVGRDGFYLVLPDGVFILLFGILPMKALYTHLRRLRRRPGMCPVCGYDLRATPNKCPECGKNFAENAATSAAD
jgi:hypothetical protein